MKSAVLVSLLLLSPGAVALAQSEPHPKDHARTCQWSHPPDHKRPTGGNHPHAANHSGPLAGNYTLQFEMHGQQTSAVLRMSCGSDGKFIGTLEVHGETIALELVGHEGQTLTLGAGSELSLMLSFKNENEFTGKWVRSDQSGSLTGARQKS